MKIFAAVAGVIGRYLLAPVLSGVLVFVVLNALAGPSSDFAATAALVAYGVASLTWIVFAVLERARTRWRLLLVWVPAVVPILLAAAIVVQGDNTGLGYLLAMMLVVIPLAPCIVGTVVALRYPRDRGSSQP